MTWGWQARGVQAYDVRGRRGTAEEAKETRAWQQYERDYLRGKMDKYAEGDENRAMAAEFAIAEEVKQDYKTEADEKLKREFHLWLEGRHPDYNTEYGGPEYDNNVAFAEGRPIRLRIERDPDGASVPSERMDNWKPTWWGKTQLMHLPGAREYMQSNLKQQFDTDLQMNLLAQYGPQNMEQAWMYFKHWVKGRPVTIERSDNSADLGDMSTFGPMNPIKSKLPDPGAFRQVTGTFGTPPGGGGTPARDFGGGTLGPSQPPQFSPAELQSVGLLDSAMQEAQEIAPLGAPAPAWLQDAEEQLAAADAEVAEEEDVYGEVARDVDERAIPNNALANNMYFAGSDPGVEGSPANRAQQAASSAQLQQAASSAQTRAERFRGPPQRGEGFEDRNLRSVPANWTPTTRERREGEVVQTPVEGNTWAQLARGNAAQFRENPEIDFSPQVNPPMPTYGRRASPGSGSSRPALTPESRTRLEEELRLPPGSTQ